jgi:hypothetical protein
MNDKDLARLIKSTLDPLMPQGVALVRSNQPTQQGTPTGSAVYFTKLFDRRYGSPARLDVWDGETFVHTERQVYVSTWQFEATVPQPAELSPSDILNIVSGIIQSDGIIAAFRAAGVGVQRVTDVRNPYIVDDRDQFAAVPSFDIVLSHRRVMWTSRQGSAVALASACVT